jgi:protein TonB
MRQAFATAFAIAVNLLLFAAMVRMVDARFTGWEDAAEVFSLDVVTLSEAPPPPDRAPPEPKEPEPHPEPRLDAPVLSFRSVERTFQPSAMLVAIPPKKFALHGRPFIGNLAASPALVSRPLRPNVRVEPQYPRRALARRIEGYVVVGFTINRDGSTSQLEVLEANPPLVFDRAALKAIERWRFDPRDEPRRDTTRFEFELGS